MIGTAIVDLKELDASKSGTEISLNLVNARKAKKIRNSKLQVRISIERHDAASSHAVHANGSNGNGAPAVDDLQVMDSE